MKLGSVTYASAIIGAIWGGLWMLITGLVLILVTGIMAQPPMGIAALVGAIAGVLTVCFPLEVRTHRWQILRGLCILIGLMLFTFVMPFGISLDNGIIWNLIFALIWSVLLSLSLDLCLVGYSTGKTNRYRLEILFLRFMKGLGFVLFSIFVMLPFYVMVMTSLKSQQSLLVNPLDFSIDFGQGTSKLFHSYIELFTQYDFGTFLINSAIVSVVTVVITLLLAVPGAYAVSRLKFPGQIFLSRSILLIYMVPAIVLVIPLYAVFSQAGLRNSLWGLLVVYPATTIPVALYMLQGYFRGLPMELEEAGLMDGLRRIGVIIKITLPLSLPALASVALYVFMIAWNEFLFAFMFLDDFDMFTLSRGVVSLNSSEVPRQHLMAGAVVATVPVLIIFLWFERYLVAGLTAGSVKG
ncbi:carbohydrate ABC transporter permease [Amylibacter sp.]|nr:carbohydrate ABC transporter permease [Amylibacter sp.]